MGRFRWLAPIVLLVLVPTIDFVAGRGTDSEQPIAYNHAKHVSEMGMVCLDCHVGAETNAHASIPNIEICGDCHEDEEAENPEERKVARHVLDEQPIPWLQVNSVPDHAYFSHRRHVVLGQVDCATCHGDVGKMEVPFSQPYREIKMSWCISCHESRMVTTECTACHR